MKHFSSFKWNGAERLLRRISSAVVGALFLFPVVGAASAQYKEAPVDESFAAKKDATLSGGVAADVKDFLNKYYLARWTVQANGSEFFDYRKELVADGTSLSGDAQKVFLDAVVDRLSKYAKADSIYPACRYNAVLAIGALDSVAGATTRDAGTPYAGALPALVEFFKSPDSTPVYVRYGALIGMVRHAELSNGNADTTKTLAPVFIDVLKPKFAEDFNLRAEIYEWFQLKALEGLANFRTAAGPGGATETLDSFKTIVDDSKAAFELRTLAARGIGAMNLPDVADYNFIELANSLTGLARDFSDDGMRFIDSELLREQVKTSAASGAAGGFGGATGGSGSMAGGAGGGMGMSGATMGGGIGRQSQKSLETTVARVRYGFDSTRQAIEGADGKSGLVAKLTAADDATKGAKENLSAVLDEIDAINKFIAEGPTDRMAGMSGAMGGGYGAVGARGKKGGETIMVDSASLKDRLREAKTRFNEMLGVDSY